MALELSQIIYTANKTVYIEPPAKTDILTYLSNLQVSAGATSLTVLDTTGFAQNNYIVVGQPGMEQTEIVQITGAVSAGTALTTSALVFSHPIDTPVYLIRYNQIQLYGSTIATDTNPTAIGSAVNIDIENNQTVIVPATEYAYYYAKYYNSQSSTYSTLSSSALAGGLPATSRAELRNVYRVIYNEPVSDLVKDSDLNVGINSWQRELWKRYRFWSFLRVTDKSNKLVQDQRGYTLPTAIADPNTNQAIVSVKISKYPELKYLDDEAFVGLTYDNIGDIASATANIGASTLTLSDSSDFTVTSASTPTGSFHVAGLTYTYTTNTVATGVLSGISPVLSAQILAGAEIWQTYTFGNPQYWTVNSGSLILYPVPSSTVAGATLIIQYWKKFVDLSNDSDSTAFPFVENCHLYLDWVTSKRKKLDIKEQEERFTKWQTDLQQLISSDADFRDVYIQPTNLYRSYY